jgi:hypothetical protein
MPSHTRSSPRTSEAASGRPSKESTSSRWMALSCFMTAPMPRTTTSWRGYGAAELRAPSGICTMRTDLPIGRRPGVLYADRIARIERGPTRRSSSRTDSRPCAGRHRRQRAFAGCDRRRRASTRAAEWRTLRPVRRTRRTARRRCHVPGQRPRRTASRSAVDAGRTSGSPPHREAARRGEAQQSSQNPCSAPPPRVARARRLPGAREVLSVGPRCGRRAIGG